jgi:hypothetical protein
MAYEALQTIVGTAIVDSGFRRSLFSKHNDVLRGFGLSREESAAIAQSQAQTIQAFAQDLQGWISSRAAQSAGG